MMILGKSCRRRCYADQSVDSKLLLETQQIFVPNFCRTILETNDESAFSE